MALLMSLCPFQLGEVYKEGHYFFSVHIYRKRKHWVFVYTRNIRNVVADLRFCWRTSGRSMGVYSALSASIEEVGKWKL